MSLPNIAITMGDPAGIGPEIIVKSIPHVLDVCQPLLIGEPVTMRYAVKRYAGDYAGRLSRDVQLFVPDSIIQVRATGSDGAPQKLSAMARGDIQYQCIRLAVSMAQKGDADAIVTGPISKEALAESGVPFPGHTELLAHLTGTHPPVMMLTGPMLRVVPLTTHCALSEVPALLTTELVEVQLAILHRDLVRYFGIENPRIALAGLNPHAGEGGLFGREEIDILVPAVARLRAQGIQVTGPLAADTAFVRAVRGEFDVVAAPTHDQALIPLKLLHFDEGVNITLGLPIIRTSPDHGTAQDIVGAGVASPKSMIAAIVTAAKMAMAGK